MIAPSCQAARPAGHDCKTCAGKKVVDLAWSLQPRLGRGTVNVNFSSSPGSRGAQGRPMVVLADHESLYRWFAKECLEAAGWRVVCFADVSAMLTFLDQTVEDVAILVDELSMRDERIEPAEILRHARSPARMCLLADAPEPMRLEPDAYVVVSKPGDRDRLAGLLA
jgi:hypothetical protein